MTSRKGFLSASALAASALLSPADAKPVPSSASVQPPSAARRRRALAIRNDAARAHYANDRATNTANGDELRYADKRASFSKTLPHDDLGEVDAAAFARFVAIVERGDPAGFDAMPRDEIAVDRLNDPQAMYAYDYVATDSAATRMPPPPAFASARMAVEMGELYWHALTLDVPFMEFGSNPLVAAAVTDLNAFPEPLMDNAKKLDAVTLFRCEFAGALRGPFVSQFLWLEVPYGPATIVQRYRFPAPGQRFITTGHEWLACQRGAAGKAKIVSIEPRWAATNSDLAAYVHKDFSFQAFMHAALIAISYGPEALSLTNPYRSSKTQFGDITFGNKMFLTLIAQAAIIAQKTSYYHKWLVHRRLRPEVMGGRIQHQLTSRKDYGIHPSILRADAVARAKSQQGTAFLALAYPEGCPTHPSYPAAHACNAGACATVLKAFFNESFVIPNTVVANATGDALEPWRETPLTLGGEFEKLAANISFARHAAGVHYRSDSLAGLLTGERQGLSLLSDYSTTFNERFAGFELTTFGGERVRIRDGAISTPG
ncbi:MAG: phosphatase PAP2 family protein [Candidatus Eremiobacteraeota bacterium]|nr:phosphatase PAP2 family protein [Candidatus Eremiobacteraeota bacterium]